MPRNQQGYLFTFNDAKAVSLIGFALYGVYKALPLPAVAALPLTVVAGLMVTDYLAEYGAFKEAQARDSVDFSRYRRVPLVSKQFVFRVRDGAAAAVDDLVDDAKTRAPAIASVVSKSL